MRIQGSWRIALVLLVAASCTRTPVPPVATERAGDRSELVELAEGALRRGEFDTAESRFQRVLASDPGSIRARTGLGRVALARGDLAVARGRLAELVDEHPESVDARIALARVEIAEGERGAATSLLAGAVEGDPARFEAHALLEDLTGSAPRTPPSSVEEAVERADAHPYDPVALLAAGVLLARSGHPVLGAAYLEKVLWLSDIEPAAAGEAARQLAAIDPAWAERRLVDVHIFADEFLRARPGWRFQVRTLWLSLSTALGGIIDVRFVPISIGACRSGDAPDLLDAIHEACFASVRRLPRSGLLAAFTARAIPSAPGRWKQGLAEFVGRRLSVRVPEDASESRVLAHEILHVYGGIHVVDAIESLMNQSGDSMRLDRANARIVRALRERRFDSGGIPSEVLPWVDLEETIAAFEQALSVNLTYRKLGLDEALKTRSLSRFQAAAEMQQAVELDEHVADVSRTLASLKFADGRGAEAVALLEVAARLYGRDTPRGRATRAQAEALRAELRRRYP